MVVVEVKFDHVRQPGKPVQVLDLVVVKPQDLQLPALLQVLNLRDLVVGQIQFTQPAQSMETLDFGNQIV